MPNTNDDATPKPAPRAKAKPGPKPKAPGSKPATDDDAAKALATYFATGHVPAGWVYTQGAMRKRTDG